MATQLQRAFGISDERRELPKGSEPRAPKKEPRGEKKGDAKADPFPNLPRRPIGVDKDA